MQAIGTIGSASNPSGTIYRTRAGNHVDAPSVHGRKTDIKPNANGTYDVTVTENGQITYKKTLSERELVANFGSDVSSLEMNPLVTNTQEDAQAKYGNKVANTFFAIA